MGGQIHMERYIKTMVKHSSYIEISQSSLKKNVNFLRKLVGPKVRISSVVKANAYGHDIRTFVPMAEKAGLSHFSTASSFEAEEVDEVRSNSSRIMIMGIMYDEDLKWAIEREIEFYVFHLDRLKLVKELAKETGKKALVHLEVETGANRTGMDEATFKKALRYFTDNSDHLSLEGMCTHFAGAESFSNRFRIENQKKRFSRFEQLTGKYGPAPQFRHLASSGATIAYPETHYDMVRIGVAQYGFWPSQDIYYHYTTSANQKNDFGLRRIFTWKTNIMDIKEVARDEFIGYGTFFQAPRAMKIAVLPLGYSNGYPRAQSNSGYVLIRGKRAPITGLINMNLFMVDISHIPDAKVGDEVVLIGRQKNNTIHVASFTQTTRLINQEMMSRLPHAIPRKVIR